MTSSQKLLLSILGAFLVPAITHLQMHLNDLSWGGKFWMGAVLAGLYPVATYLVGFYQINPANQPRSAEALITAVEASPLPNAAKETTTRALRNVITPESPSAHDVI